MTGAEVRSCENCGADVRLADNHACVKAVVIRMPADLHRQVKEKAAAEDRSMAQAMRWALRRWVDGT